MHFDKMEKKVLSKEIVSPAFAPRFSHRVGKNPQAELRTLIAFCYAYGFMNVFDQGVFVKSDDYRLSRDYPFTFGYGAPENQTLPFYGKKPQPVKCSNPAIRTTQVIRPDGKALIMIGNLGEETVAEFDISGLKYAKYTVYDVFNKKELPKAAVKVGKRSYAMLEIRKAE